MEKKLLCFEKEHLIKPLLRVIRITDSLKQSWASVYSEEIDSMVQEIRANRSLTGELFIDRAIELLGQRPKTGWPMTTQRLAIKEWIQVIYAFAIRGIDEIEKEPPNAVAIFHNYSSALYWCGILTSSTGFLESAEFFMSDIGKIKSSAGGMSGNNAKRMLVTKKAWQLATEYCQNRSSKPTINRVAVEIEEKLHQFASEISYKYSVDRFVKTISEFLKKMPDHENLFDLSRKKKSSPIAKIQ